MTRGISDPAPIEEESKDDSEQPSNSDILNYLDELSEFVRELDIRISTIEKFVIRAPEEETADKNSKKKTFFTSLKL